MTKYGPKAQVIIDKTMHEFAEGKLRSGQSSKKVQNRRQAVAIGISKAREDHMKVPDRLGD